MALRRFRLSALSVTRGMTVVFYSENVKIARFLYQWKKNKKNELKKKKKKRGRRNMRDE